MGSTFKQETKEFQAEVKQLLDIVINSLYTDREVFLRELISNSADALEKIRYIEITGQNDQGESQNRVLPLEISIELDESASTLSIIDTGIGMTRKELMENLGTIAHSGSRAFIKHLVEGDREDVNLIGQFGLGFYASFMVASQVTVYSRSYRPGAAGHVWTSEGTGSFTISEAEGLSRGTKIVLQLKEDAKEFAQPDTVKRIIKQYSAFVPFPIALNGEKVNTVQALWVKNKNEITGEEYTEFYKYVANDFDEPFYRIHMTLDAPLSINALLFVPRGNFELYGFGRMEPGVNVYCRKVLIQQQFDGILPEWLRFLKGVVDSEELPLNVSREAMQDSALVSKLRRVITGRVLRFFDEQAEKDPEKYREFWEKFGMFIKEGAASDFVHRDRLVKLLRFESSKSEAGQLISLSAYVEGMPPEQEDIYYVNGPSREAIESGPYLEAFRDLDLELIYTSEPVDDYILNQLGEFEGKKLVSADQEDLKLPGAKQEPPAEGALPEAEIQDLTEWMKGVLGDKVTEVRPSKRLVDSPAMVLSPDGVTGSMQRMMQLMHKDVSNIGSKILEINPAHPIVSGLNNWRQKDEEFARTVLEQVFDNALVSAGLIVEPRYMVDRIYKIMERTLS